MRAWGPAVVVACLGLVTGCQGERPYTTTHVHVFGDISDAEVTAIQAGLHEWEVASSGAVRFTFEDGPDEDECRQWTIEASEHGNAEVRSLGAEAVSHGFGKSYGTTYLGPASRVSAAHLQRVAAHEAGHVLGIEHHLTGIAAMSIDLPIRLDDSVQVNCEDVAAFCVQESMRGIRCGCAKAE